MPIIGQKIRIKQNNILESCLNLLAWAYFWALFHMVDPPWEQHNEKLEIMKSSKYEI